jgi:outer membrane protein assembly factor BamB
MVLVFSADTRAADWPMWRYDAQHTACSPDPLPAKMKLQWMRELPAPQPAWPPTQNKLQFDLSYEPIVVGHRVIVPSMVSDHVTAYNTETGQLEWRFYTEGPTRFAPVAYKGHVFAGSDDGYVYCLDTEDGSLQWKSRAAPADRKIIGNDRLISAWPVRGAPVIYDDTLYFAASIWPFMGIFIYALNPETGEEIWCNSGSGSMYIMQQHHSEAFAGVAPQGYMTATEDRLLVPGGRTVPALYDRETGAYQFFKPEERYMGKDAGGYAVAAREEWFFNSGGYARPNGALYTLEDESAIIRARASVLAEDAMLTIEQPGKLVAYDYRTVKQPYVDRKGQRKTRDILGELWGTELTSVVERIFIKAGDYVYGCTNESEVVAIALTEENPKARVTWKRKVKGSAWSMLAGDDRLFVVTREGELYCYGEADQQPQRHRLPNDKGDAIKDEWTTTAQNILKLTKAKEGYCLVLGLDSGRLVTELAAQSRLKIIGIDPDAEKVDSLRRMFDEQGLYGSRVAFHTSSILDGHLPPYLAHLVVSERLGAQDLEKIELFARQVFRSLRPYGGIVCLDLGDQQAALAAAVNAAQLANAKVSQSGRWSLLTRVGELPGSADWTHQYADAGNSVVSADALAKAPLGLLWFGGPSHAKILPRHGHGPSPQVAGGRLFIEGPDIIRALDVYTGRLLWEKNLPGVGKYYDYTSHEPGANAIGSNYVSLADGIYTAYGHECLQLDPTNGQVRSRFKLPGKKTKTPEWGYLGISGDLLLAGAQPMSFWEPDFEPDEFKNAKPEELASATASIRAWRDFEFVTDAANDTDFIVKNLNKALDDSNLISKFPMEVCQRNSDNKDWSKRATDLQKQLQTTNDPQMIRRLNRSLLAHCYGLQHKNPPQPGRFNTERTASKELIAMNRHTGKVLWTFEAKYALRHNAIVISEDKVFCIDRLPAEATERLKRRGRPAPSDARLVALDAASGKEAWSTTEDVFGTWLGYSAEHDVLVQAGSKSRDRANDEIDHGLAVYKADNGDVLWKSDMQYEGPILLHHDTLITQTRAFHLLTGQQKTRKHPLTGRDIPWTFARNYGCNTAVGSEHLLTFRSAAAGYYNLATDGGTGNFGGFKSGCTSNLIVANGILNAPEYTRTCDCSYQNQTSLALVHDPTVETWTFNAIKKDDAPIRQVGINFSAPGDRVAEDGTLWLDYPSVGGPSPNLSINRTPEQVRFFRHHASRMVTNNYNWVFASGMEGVTELKIALAKEQKLSRTYTVRLFFAEMDEDQPGQRTFDITIQGKPAFTQLDVAKEAGGTHRGIVKESEGIQVTNDLALGFSSNAIISGIEVIIEGQ